MKRLNSKYIIQEYKKGRTQLEIANELGTYNTSIRRILIKNNIDIRSNREIQQFVSYNPFYKKTSLISYWLGLLSADGCVTRNEVVLGLTESDVYLLEDYIKIYKSDKLRVHKYFNKRYKIYEYEVRFKNEEIVSTLYTLGITQRKSFTLKYNGIIDWDYFRGYFDGDGSVGTYNGQTRIQIVSGSYKIIEQLKLFLLSNSITSYVYKYKNKQKYTLNIYKQKSLLQMYDLMYYSNNIYYLKRKREKFGPLLEKFKRL